MINSRLKEILEKRGMSQRELARRTGIDPIYINRLANKQMNVTMETAGKIADVLAMPVEQIFVPETKPDSVQQK